MNNGNIQPHIFFQVYSIYAWWFDIKIRHQVPFLNRWIIFSCRGKGLKPHWLSQPKQSRLCKEYTNWKHRQSNPGGLDSTSRFPGQFWLVLDQQGPTANSSLHRLKIHLTSINQNQVFRNCCPQCVNVKRKEMKLLLGFWCRNKVLELKSKVFYNQDWERLLTFLADFAL